MKQKYLDEKELKSSSKTPKGLWESVKFTFGTLFGTNGISNKGY